MTGNQLDARTLSLVYSGDAFSRLDEADDREFYTRSRFVQHLDATALATVERLVAGLVTEEKPAILDLMAGWDSHLPAGLEAGYVIGLGLAENELRRNPELDERLIHDLNRDPRLPFDDDSIDVVLNTVSVGYLTRPFDVFLEVERVLKPGGLFLVVFSDRMFHQKAVKLWRRAGAEERVWLVEDYFASAGFDKPTLFVSEGRPRPAGDAYAGKARFSDPVYAVFAEKRGGDPGRPARSVPDPGADFAPDPAEVERRKQVVGRTLRCPYCDQPMIRWEVPDTPFIQWDNEYVYVCFNDECPYMLEGWEAMRQQGNPGFTYRLMYDPDRNSFKPVPLPSARALQDTVILERG